MTDSFNIPPQRDLESLTAYVHRMETLINDIEKEMKERTDSQYDQLNSHIRFVEKAQNVRLDELKDSIAATDRARARGDDAMHDLVTRTANSLYAEIKAISAPPTPPFDPERITRLEEGRAADYEMLADHQKLLEKIEDRFTVLENAVKHRPFQVSVTDDIHGLTAYVHNLESLIHDTAKNLNRRLNDHLEDIEALDKRVEQLEANQLRWFTETRPEPAPQRDTDWRPYTGTTNADCPVHIDDYVEVLTRDNHHTYGNATIFNWGNDMLGGTIVAWRYAKEIK